MSRQWTIQELSRALEEQDLSPIDDRFEQGDGRVVVPEVVGDDWEQVQDALTDTFAITKEAIQAEQAVTYVLSNEALLGREGPGPAMLVAGLLSGARTLAIEMKKAAIPVNVVVYQPDTDVNLIARWVRILRDEDGPTGEVIHLGADHLGKALP